MRVKIIKENKEVEVNDGYGARLIEQGKAVLVHEKKPKRTEQAVKDAAQKNGKGA